jgi:hypothetical protein
MRKLQIFLLLFTLVYACESQDISGTRGPQEAGKGEAPAPAVSKSHSLEIVPMDASRDTVFYAIPRNFKLTDGQLEWLINEQPAKDVSAPHFTASQVRKGDSVQARATVNGLQLLSNTVVIKNSPPEISGIRIMPKAFKPGDTPYADVASRDRDDDAVSMSYSWTINGQPAGVGQKLATMPRRGDKLLVTVIPFDGTDHGDPVEKDLEIGNIPPMIVEHKEFTFDEKVYSYQVKATDPDGDTLTYSLKSSPEGMTIDPSAGLFQWVVPPDFTGEKNVTVVVTDGHGGSSTYTLKLTIQQQPSKESQVPGKQRI